jgi:hypothetical protein
MIFSFVSSGYAIAEAIAFILAIGLIFVKIHRFASPENFKSKYNIRLDTKIISK